MKKKRKQLDPRNTREEKSQGHAGCWLWEGKGSLLGLITAWCLPCDRTPGEAASKEEQEATWW